ncbi:uncharacterized protein LOC130648746 [Hydractinia symbiolongicarpus]|uniref:uncharacterized protein LOC130648746 n=1 Tax=Hydractinia symbiolongicarpus TaxID=13093 RepID=UPI00254D2427|nr:uncharacterized protein LOC130648746 [Hydractinia symbiolongicarpus]
MVTNMQSYIKYNILRVLKENLEKTIHFYTKVCGMEYVVKTVSKQGYPYTWSDNKIHVFTYKQKSKVYQPTGICFIVDENFKVDYEHRGYWKTGLALADLNAAARYFRKNGYEISDGEQFFDVGFVAFIKDPNGYSIELLQHTFEENFQPYTGEVGCLDQPKTRLPCIGQITHETRAIKPTYDFYTNVLQMKHVCEEQPGNKLAFTLYFFTYTEEEPVNKILSAVENREWLYGKEFCQVEIRHRHTTPKDFNFVTNDRDGVGKLGHVGISLCVSSDVMENIKQSVTTFDVCRDVDGVENIFIQDPDGLSFRTFQTVTSSFIYTSSYRLKVNRKYIHTSASKIKILNHTKKIKRLTRACRKQFCLITEPKKN